MASSLTGQSGDSDLASKVNEGAVVEVLEGMQPKLLAMARRLIGPDIQSKFGPSDVVQQTYLDAVRALPHVRPQQRGQLFAWVYTLLRNNYLDSRKGYLETDKRDVSRERQIGLDEDQAKREPGPLAKLMKEEELASILRAMRRLPSAHQQLLKWRFMDDLSYREIGTRVGRNEDAVRMTIVRIVNRLRQGLQEIE
jgi:RNA polymerase sigma factor (sigma-70 family)